MQVREYNKSVDDFSDGLFRFVVKNIRNEEKARDIVQDTFVKLWQKVEEVSAEKVKSYLFTTAYRTMIDYIRKDKRQTEFTDAHADKLSHSEQYSDINEILHQALETLPPQQKSVVMLRDYEGYSYDEIGEITSLNPSQVKVYIYRARVALKKYLVSIDFVI